MKKYHKFIKEACMLEGEHCLKDYIYEHCKDYDLRWHQHLYGKKTMSDALRFATTYHAHASSSMTLSWMHFTVFLIEHHTYWKCFGRMTFDFSRVDHTVL